MDCSPWNSLGQNTGVGSLSLLQGFFPAQGLNPGLPHYRQILYLWATWEAPTLATTSLFSISVSLFLFHWSEVKVAQLCPTLSNPMDYTVHEILQARILERVAFPSSRGSSQPRYWIQVSCIAGGFFTSWATMEAQEYRNGAQTEVSGKSLYKLKLISIHIGISVLQ